jgi:hypothetical protein
MCRAAALPNMTLSRLEGLTKTMKLVTHSDQQGSDDLFIKVNKVVAAYVGRGHLQVSAAGQQAF